MSSVSVIIPVLNNWELTCDCLEQLAAHTPPVMVIVVDNGSDDATPEACPTRGRTLFGERFVYQRTEHNRNFGPACNAAAWSTDADMLLFLNNDTQVGPGWLPPLLRELDQPDTVGVGPLLTYPDGDVQHLGIAFWPGTGGVSHLYRNIPATHPLAQRSRRFQALTAATLLVRRRDFAAVGGFDEGYINGFEDVDLGLRLTAGGRTMTCVPHSRVVHLESRTPRRAVHDGVNSARLAAVWSGTLHADLPELVALDGYCLRVLPDLELTIDLPAARQRACLRTLGPFEPTRCYALLEQEPFWRQGYELLGSFFEQQGLFEAAATLYARQFQIIMSPAPDEYTRLQQARCAAGQDAALVAAGSARQRGVICDARTYAAKLDASLAGLQMANPLHAALAQGYQEAAAEAARLRMLWKENIVEKN